MSMVLLPTYGVVRDFYQGALKLDLFDYDLDELISLTLDALMYSDWYPQSFDETISIETGSCRPNYPEEKVPEFNALLSMLYHRLYAALMTTGLYVNGALQHTYFCIYDHDIVVSDKEIPGELGERQW